MRDDDPPLDAAEDGCLFVIGVVYLGHIAENRKDLDHQFPVRQLQPVAGIHHGRGNMTHLSRDTVRIEDKIHKPGRDGAPGHAVELGALRGLHDDQAVALLDRADAVCPV